jgi:uncharacterized protein (TIGR00661 family)
MSNSKKIFIAPLDWGLGHASRCIPVIDTLLKKGCSITIGGTGRSGVLLKKEYPEVPFIEMPGFCPVLSAGKSQVLALILNLPLLILMSFREFFFLKKLQKEANFDIIISDHRYGIRNKQAFNIMIIHQLRYKTPFILKPFGKISYLINKLLLSPYQEVWIPDFETQPNFSGELSHGFDPNPTYKYVGILSRFEGMTNTCGNEKKHILAIISGPEPQRSKLEKLLISRSATFSKLLVIVAGQPEAKDSTTNMTNVIRYSHLPKEKLIRLINDAELVVARSGYSTIMDLAKLGAKAIFIPTPGQSEQEYLAKLLLEAEIAFSVKQHLFDIGKHIDQALQYKGFRSTMTENRLCETVDVMMKSI